MKRLLLSLLLCAGCGYRATGSAIDSGEGASLGPVDVPAFVSYAGYPELDVRAGAYLAQRLALHGLDAGTRDAPLEALGTLVAARETPRTLNAEQTVVDIEVRLRVDVSSDSARCATPESSASVLLALPLIEISESERLAALQSATEQAIDALLLDVIVCLEGV